MNVLDYTDQSWGHALHASTLRPKKADKFVDRIQDSLKNRRRYSVMIHSSEYPYAGDILKYNARKGTVNARIVSTNPCGDPRDMFTVEITVEDKDQNTVFEKPKPTVSANGLKMTRFV